jgi:hypothetical protein
VNHGVEGYKEDRARDHAQTEGDWGREHQADPAIDARRQAGQQPADRAGYQGEDKGAGLGRPGQELKHQARLSFASSRPSGQGSGQGSAHGRGAIREKATEIIADPFARHRCDQEILRRRLLEEGRIGHDRLKSLAPSREHGG